MLFMF